MDELREQARSLTEVPLDLIRQVLDKHHRAMCEELRDQVRQFVNERNHWRDLYQELIYAVQSKHPEENRHQTALRYIREREAPSNVAAKAECSTGGSERG